MGPDLPRAVLLRAVPLVRSRDGPDLVDDAQVALEVVARGARVGRAPVGVGDAVGGTDPTGEEAVAERRVRNEADVQLAQLRQDLRLRIPGPQGVLGPQSGNGVDGVRANCRCAATPSADRGPSTMSSPTPPGANASTTRSSATSPSNTWSSPSKATPTRPSSSTPRNPLEDIAEAHDRVDASGPGDGYSSPTPVRTAGMRDRAAGSWAPCPASESQTASVARGGRSRRPSGTPGGDRPWGRHAAHGVIGSLDRAAMQACAGRRRRATPIAAACRIGTMSRGVEGADAVSGRYRHGPAAVRRGRDTGPGRVRRPPPGEHRVFAATPMSSPCP